MDTGGDRGERGERAGGGSGISRRHFFVSGLLGIGASSQLIDQTTSGAFSDEASTVSPASVASLERTIIDNSDGETDTVEYQIGYEVILDSGFDYIDISVENLSGTNGDTFTEENEKKMTFTYTHGHGVNSHEYKFTFKLYIEGSSNPVFTESTTDIPGGGNPPGNDDPADEDSPELEWMIVDDSSHSQHGLLYDVYYQVSKVDNYSGVEVEFDRSNKSHGEATIPSSSGPIGHVQHSEEGADGIEFDITTRVKDGDSFVVDSETITDTSDGTDPPSIGTPSLSDSPSLDSFTVKDETSGNETAFSVDYTIDTADRLGRVDVIFDHRGDSDHANETVEDPIPSDDPITYPPDNQTYQTGGDTYHVTVEAFEEREGVTFPIYSGTVEVVAGESPTTTTYPEDSL